MRWVDNQQNSQASNVEEEDISICDECLANQDIIILVAFVELHLCQNARIRIPLVGYHEKTVNTLETSPFSTTS